MTRRVATLFVGSIVLAVAVAAIVDTVRPRPPPALDAEAAAQLDDLGVDGTLVYTDPACELHALSLPDLKPGTRPKGPDLGCEISLSPDGKRVASGGARWSADGTLYAICRGRRVDVVPGPQAYDGCAPAWRPDGMLTFARDGAIRQARFEEIVVPRRELVRAARTHPNAPELPVGELRVRDLAWPSLFDVIALIEARYRLGLPEFQTTVAGFRYGRLRWREPHSGGYERLVVSARGDVLVEPAVRAQIPVLGNLDPAGPIDWSPDGRLLAVGTRASIFVVEVSSQRLVRIPVTARDLAWR
jgi:hypothetical protein